MNHSARGFVMITVVLLLTSLTLIGLLVMDTIANTADFAGARYQTGQALYLAESGVRWALGVLEEEPYWMNESTEKQHPEVIASKGTIVPEKDKLCFEDSTCREIQWRYLDAGNSGRDIIQNVVQKNANHTDKIIGTHVVMARYNDLSDEDPHTWIITIRSLGRTSEGTEKMLEVDVGNAIR